MQFARKIVPLVFLKVTFMIQAEIHTVKGVMKVNFFEKDAPLAVANFV